MFDRLVVGTLPLVPKPVIFRFARRYIAGLTLDDAVRTVRELEAEGAMSTIDVLGEAVTRREQTEATRDEYLRVLDVLSAQRLPANVSVKPTALGLSIDPKLVRENFRAICRKAAESQTFVRIDMEDSPYTESTLALALELKEEFPNVGVVVQAYMRRTLRDMDRLVAARMNVRICKGIYVEPRALAYKDRQVVIESFAAIVDKHLSAGCYAGIATHDEACVQRALATIDRLKLTPDRYEFPMLLGVDPLRRTILAAGHRLRVYVPYGRDWYKYSVRRLKENPSIAGHTMRSILGIGPAQS
ncbi:MAG TPA: proline dehydrogenase family protein [Thermoanaerobaculia bacterium]|nr:proline dehydrogenase family protein [Thermoanaerobaculia bacterium]